MRCLVHGGGVAEGGHSESDGGRGAGAAVDLGEFVFGAGEADLESFGFAGPVGFQNSAIGSELGFYADRSYSLMRPPRTGRRLIRSRDRSATG